VPTSIHIFFYDVYMKPKNSFTLSLHDYYFQSVTSRFSTGLLYPKPSE